ncbi:MAG: SOS response-associated peptidase [Candidatus Limnocylindria bacterium]
MCGRFAQPRSADELARIFRARPVTDLAGDRFNVAPTDPVAAVAERHGERTLDEYRWGLVPFFAESPKGAARLINARSETVETSPAFRTAFRDRRCIVPADAFYEWRRHRDPATGRVRRSEPFALRLASGQPLGLAGLWAVWRDPETAQRLYSVTILTAPPNELVATVHDRMPVILDPDDWDPWLHEATPRRELRALLRPAPAEAMAMYPVSPAVNNVRSDGPHLLAPLTRWAEGDSWDAGARS